MGYSQPVQDLKTKSMSIQYYPWFIAIHTIKKKRTHCPYLKEEKHKGKILLPKSIHDLNDALCGDPFVGSMMEQIQEEKERVLGSNFWEKIGILLKDL